MMSPRHEDDEWLDPTQIRKGGPMEVSVPKILELLERDPYLRNHEREIRRRYGNFEDFLNRFVTSFNFPDLDHRLISFISSLIRMKKVEGGIEAMAKGYDYFGCREDSDGSFVMREWAPAAQEMWLMGDFNDWNQFSHPFKKLEFGRN